MCLSFIWGQLKTWLSLEICCALSRSWNLCCHMSYHLVVWERPIIIGEILLQNELIRHFHLLFAWFILYSWALTVYIAFFPSMVLEIASFVKWIISTTFIVIWQKLNCYQLSTWDIILKPCGRKLCWYYEKSKFRDNSKMGYQTGGPLAGYIMHRPHPPQLLKWGKGCKTSRDDDVTPQVWHLCSKRMIFWQLKDTVILELGRRTSSWRSAEKAFS